MILYKFLNGDKTASAKYITDAFYVVEATKDFIPNEFNKTTSNQLSIALGTGVKYKWMVMANIGNSSVVIVPSREFTVA